MPNLCQRHNKGGHGNRHRCTPVAVSIRESVLITSARNTIAVDNSK